jgi:hypothetical protein
MKIAELETALTESWSKKYKRSINCDHPKGFSQRAHCAGRRARRAGRKTKSHSTNESAILTEAWFLPILAAAVRAGAPAVARLLSKPAVQAAARGSAQVTANLGKAVIANPGKAAAIASSAYVYKSVTDAIDSIREMVGTALDTATVKSLAAVAVKYALPAAAIVAVLYGGKRLYDYMQSSAPSTA